MKNVIEVKSNLLNIYLTKIRDKKSNSLEFRSALKVASSIIANKILENIDQKEFVINSPLEKTKGFTFGKEIILLPILRAGEGMLGAFQELIQNPKIGFIGISRDELTLKPKLYLKKIPKINKDSKIIILDPMLATGGSILLTLEILFQFKSKDITIASIISSPEGINNIISKCRNVKIFTGKIDRELNKKGYILPGLGDAGDRLYDT